VYGARSARAGIDYRAWLANFRAPEVFARARATVHVPRRPYSDALPGIPTIRPFEALACAVPLVCAPWRDSENLFTPGRDYLTAEDGDEMIACLSALRDEPERAAALARHGRQTILARHTCAHRADELLAIDHELASGNTTGNSFSFMGDIA
jgi:spore maturation protein CgeB